MKICIWITKIFDLGGTKRVVSLLANELVKEHEVTIMTYEAVSYTHLDVYKRQISGNADEPAGAW